MEAHESVLKAFKLTQEALRSALKDRSKVEKEIAKLQQDMIKLALFYDVEAPDPIAQMGLTDAIRYLIGEVDEEGITTTALQETLIAARVRLATSNPRAAIQTVLKRLVIRGEIEECEPSKWVWVSEVSPPVPPVPDWMMQDLDM